MDGIYVVGLISPKIEMVRIAASFIVTPMAKDAVRWDWANKDPVNQAVD